MPANAKNVLIVEDNAVAREGLAVVLRREGHQVALVENGLVAINYLRENPTPHVILLDMHLPVLDGLALFRKNLRTAPQSKALHRLDHGQSPHRAGLGHRPRMRLGAKTDRTGRLV